MYDSLLFLNVEFLIILVEEFKPTTHLFGFSSKIELTISNLDCSAAIIGSLFPWNLQLVIITCDCLDKTITFVFESLKCVPFISSDEFPDVRI